MIFPALDSAADDRSLRGAPLEVYLYLACRRLDFENFTPIKIAALAFSMRTKEDTIARALRLLVDGGYIERKYVARTGYGYRLRMRKAS